MPPYGCYGILWLDVFVWSSAKCLRVFTHLAQQTLTWTFQHRCAQTGNTSPGFPSGTGLVLRAQLQCRNMCLADVCLVYLYQKKRNQLQHKKSKQTKRGKTSKIFEKQPCFFLSLSLALLAARHFDETLPTLSRSASSHPKSWKVNGVNSFITNVAERAVPNDKSPAW